MCKHNLKFRKQAKKTASTRCLHANWLNRPRPVIRMQSKGLREAEGILLLASPFAERNHPTAKSKDEGFNRNWTAFQHDEDLENPDKLQPLL